MNSARRQHKRMTWPRGLREPRPGYYAFELPDGRIMAIGRVPLAVAKMEATAANLHLAEQRPSLVERIQGASRTVADLMARMPVSERPNTAKSHRSLDKIITAAIGTKAVAALTVEDCAQIVEAQTDAGKKRQAEAVRSRLIAICKKGMALGWMDFDPASVTERPKVKVLRGRLTLDTFKLIYAKAPEVAEWLQHAMALALVTGADRSTIAGLQRSDVADGCLTITRSKTGARIAIPLALRMNCMGWTLSDLVTRRTGVVSRYLVHHVSVWGNAPAGSKVHPDRISHAFTEARKLAKIPDDAAPTMHEIRSLAARLYREQGNVDVKALLGHADQKMTDKYQDARGVEAMKVRVG